MSPVPSQETAHRSTCNLSLVFGVTLTGALHPDPLLRLNRDVDGEAGRTERLPTLLMG